MAPENSQQSESRGPRTMNFSKRNRSTLSGPGTVRDCADTAPPPSCSRHRHGIRRDDNER
ncbi:hypothetical protein C5613_31495 [Rhodococcus opacus]|uniref:Uncharacterized protein n=1 Tax=Rhodococcus opacus TaxID=37919 RepID=A0A2S8IW62_RHOOP|nr:hypothetical protein C5613_31495 [Rhodococcus opacus]